MSFTPAIGSNDKEPQEADARVQVIKDKAQGSVQTSIRFASWTCVIRPTNI